MKITHACNVSFTWAEVQRLLADEIEHRANKEVAGSLKNLRLLELADRSRKGHSYVEYAKNDDGLLLFVDGIAFTEEL
jgi:hypothetical protein